MYWWNVKKLAEDLREGRVDEKERFKYFLATFVAWNLIVPLFIYAGGPFDADRLVSAALNLTVAAIGIILCYRANKGGDNTDFVSRMICLGWPIGVQLVTMLSGLILFMVVVLSPVGAPPGTGTLLPTIGKDLLKIVNWLPQAAIVAICLFFSYYLRIRAYLALVARVNGAQDACPMEETALSDGEILLGFIGGIGSLFITMYGFTFFPGIVGLRSLGELLTCLAAGSWLMLFVLIIGWSRGRRSAKVTTATSNSNQ